MSVVATLTVSAEQFPLTRVLPDDSTVSVRVERILDAPEGATPVFWVSGAPAHIEQVETNLARLDEASDLTNIDEVAGKTLYRVTWRDDAGDLLTRFGDGPGRLLCALGDADGCEFVVEFPDEASLEQLRGWCSTHHVPVDDGDVHRISNGDLDVEVDTEPTGSDLFIALTDGLPLSVHPSST